MSNKIKYGLKNVHYSVITEAGGVVTYATPEPIPGAVNISLSAVGEKTEFFADDSAYFVTTANDGYEGDLEIALIPDHFRTAVLGEITDANGALIENADVLTKDFALMFEFNGDANATRHVLYNVNAARPNLEGKTKEKSLDPQTETLAITASPAVDTKNVKAKLKTTDTGYDTFFDAVYLEDAPTNTIASATDTFSKADPADITLDLTSDSVTNKVFNVKCDGVLIPGVDLTIVGIVVTIAQAYFAALDDGDYTITVEMTKGAPVTCVVSVIAGA